MTAYNDAVLADSPNIYFKLDETSGTTFANTAYSGATPASLTKGGNVSFTNGISSTGGAFFSGAGTTSVLTSSANATGFEMGRSHDFWIKTTDSNATVMSWSTSVPSRIIVTINSSGQISYDYRFSANAGSDFRTNTSSVAINDGNWHHIAFAANTSSHNSRIYVDGTEVGFASGNAGILSSGSGSLMLGFNTSAAFAGTIDEFATYTNELNSTRVNAHKNAATFNVGVDVSVPTPTMALQTNEVSVSTPINTSVDVETPTLSIASQDVSEVSTETVLSALQLTTMDGYFDLTGSGYSQDANTSVTISNGSALVAKFQYPTAGVNVMKAVNIHYSRNSNTGANSYRLYAIEAPWNASSTSLTLSSSFLTLTGEQLDNFDIKSLIDPSKFYGLLLTQPGAGNTSNWKTKEFGFKESEVLVIHTDAAGEITKKDLDVAREAARDIDKAESKVKAIVSVMMLREGWDVRNVTVVLGLRPFTAMARAQRLRSSRSLIAQQYLIISCMLRPYSGMIRASSWVLYSMCIRHKDTQKTAFDGFCGLNL